jgi:hypothetical protein
MGSVEQGGKKRRVILKIDGKLRMVSYTIFCRCHRDKGDKDIAVLLPITLV